MTFRPIILISTCELYEKNGCNQACRDTWIKAINNRVDNRVDYKFVMGAGSSELSDNIILPCDDGYSSVTFKTRDGHRWALENGYTHFFQCFPDTYLHIDRLLNSEFAPYHYVGHARNSSPEPLPGDYASGGAGYWLDSFATELLITETPENELERWAEDLWVGRVLGKHGIAVKQDRRYSHNDEGGGVTPTNNTISVHLSRGTGTYDPVWMYNTHSGAGF